MNSIQNTNKLIFDEISISRLVVYFIISKNIFYFWDDKVKIFPLPFQIKNEIFFPAFISPNFPFFSKPESYLSYPSINSLS